MFVVSIIVLNFGKCSNGLCVFGRPWAQAICANLGRIAFFSDSAISPLLPNEELLLTEELLNQQIKKILFMSWNGFPNYISKENETEIFFRLPYAGSKCEQLVKHCLKKMRRCLKINVKFVVTYNTKIISFYCNVKDKVSHE